MGTQHTQHRQQFSLRPVRYLVHVVGLLLLLSACSTAPISSSNSTPSVNNSPSATSGSSPTPVASPFHPGAGADDAVHSCADAIGWCMTPEQLQTFYNLNPLYAQGYDGKGQTILILVSYGSPTIQNDLHVFDQTFGLPDPPSFQVVSPLGAADPGGQSSWEGETTIDVEVAHTIAPGANITVLVSPDDETEGVYGFPQYEQILTYALDHQLGQVVSYSGGTSESNLDGDPCNEGLGTGQALMQQYDQQVFQPAEKDHVTFMIATGDSGATLPDCNEHTFSYPNIAWPASDPLVTAVGGTDLTLNDDAGDYGSEVAWNGSGSGGGGISQFFSEPDWQKRLPDQAILKGKRGIPDVAAQASGHLPVYGSFAGQGGWNTAYGTSMSTPLWAGLVAVANQLAGKPLGFLNPALYQLAGQGFHDITQGDNGYANVQGFSAGPGWDLVTGWGSPNAAVLLPKLVAAVAQLGG